jgi:CheY-like chemotaxis protein
MRAEIEEIKKAGERAGSLTQQLLAFSRRQVLLPKVLDLNAIVGSMGGMLQRLLGEDIHLVTALDHTLGPVRADPGQLEQVMMNLVVNARDAMPQGGKLTIETTTVEIKDMYHHGQVVVPGRYAMLAVSDNGCGMDAVTKSHLFEPFFTTKGPGMGTGLGLSTVYGIVRQSGGYVFAYSELGHGSTFKVYVPRVEDAVEALELGLPTPELPQGTETILLVEDEPGVRALVRDTLMLQGYTVLEARHGIEALMIGTQKTGVIHLLLTDVVMPQMGGREVADRLLAARSDLRVLYMSGYTENAVVHRGVLNPGTAFLQKPFTPDLLVYKVREVLDAERG